MDATKDAIVSIVFSQKYGWNDMKAYVDSVNQSSFRGRKVMFVHDVAKPTLDKLRTAGFEIVPVSYDGISVSIKRWGVLAEWLEREQIRFVISCDFRDVVVQSDPSVWLEANVIEDAAVAQSTTLFGASECYPLWRDKAINGMWIKNLYGADTAWVGENDILCAGTVAGTAATVKRFAQRVYDSCKTHNHWGDDQAAVNRLMRTEFADCTRVPKNEDAFVATVTWLVGSGGDESRRYLTDVAPYMKDGVLYAPDSYKPFCIVHQYDRSTTWRDAVHRKYAVAFSQEGIPNGKLGKYAKDGLTIDWWDTHEHPKG
jgi:hypothetical protein